MRDNVIYVNFATRRNLISKTKVKRKRKHSIIQKTLELQTDEKSLFIRSLAFRFLI